MTTQHTPVTDGWDLALAYARPLGLFAPGMLMAARMKRLASQNPGSATAPVQTR